MITPRAVQMTTMTSQNRLSLMRNDSFMERCFPLGPIAVSSYPMVSATPRFSKELVRRLLQNGLRRCRVIVLRLGHHQPKPERGDSGNAGQGQKGATIARSLNDHPTDGIAARRPDTGGSADRAVCDIEAAGAAGQIGHDEDREHTKNTRPDA